ncbi:biotin--[acetyl-CoA-carboxylase] ligase [Allorhizocola rhizosphaerae]|uniref:biotin--[acetyl-CoA-carboxylase] ligase n=1 Tax=Allorhizocola rhizosphaerae TaxID=1872709 RepID=UPI000E3EBC87|nr:biotin--[acetyl-CoA-carboxylase] ligase [Allorhizocola rhizosphaerae]
MYREPIDQAALSTAIHPWVLDLREETGSTNADAARAAADGHPEGLVIIAESQVAGRGRMGRSWVSPPRAGLAMSILLRPPVEIARWGWLPLLTGLALTDVVPGSGLKWPNDLLIDGRKCAGILVEAVPAASRAATGEGAAIVGIGLNVSATEDELPPMATSLYQQDLEIDRTRLAAAVIGAFKARYADWPDEDPRAAYLERCVTIGRDVRVLLPGDRELAGVATAVDAEGRLLVRLPDGRVCPIAAGDVTHVR